MKIEGKKIWQQAAGDTNRDYIDLCLKWNVILNGPGSYGRWPDCQQNLHSDISPKKVTDLRRFCEEIKSGDLVVLRIGTKTVAAVGEIIGSYEHHEQFNDVDGWDLGHVRRVRWLWEYKDEPKYFPTYTLKRGDTTQELSAPEVITWMESLDIPETAYSNTPIELPDNGDRNIDITEISEHLFDEGVASLTISKLLDEIDELVCIANWYSRKGQFPSERETVSYLVVPLLRALGWTPQRMAVEWNRIDLALFDRLPRTEENLSVVVEAKKKDFACLSAFSQAQNYAQELTNCNRIVVTDGLRYGVFKRDRVFSSQQHNFSPYAYLNLTRLRTEYPLYECKGSKEALYSMTPEWLQSV